MKAILFLCLAMSALAGCTSSTVITYDSNGKMIGKCVASPGFNIGVGASCTGTAPGTTIGTSSEPN